MAESLISILIVGVMLVASLNILSGAALARQVRADKGQGQNLALDLLWEIIPAFYEEPGVAVDQTMTDPTGGKDDVHVPVVITPPEFGTETGEVDGTRRYFDDVDDYHGWTSSPPQGKVGAALTGYDGWTRSVEVHWVSQINPNVQIGADRGLKRFRVTATSPSGKTTTVQALRVRSSGFDVEPTSTSPTVAWVGMELQPVGASAAVYGGTGSLNQPD